MTSPTDRSLRWLSGMNTGPVRAGIATSLVILSILALAGDSVLLVFDAPLSERIRGTSLIGLWGKITIIGGTELALAIATVTLASFPSAVGVSPAGRRGG